MKNASSVNQHESPRLSRRAERRAQKRAEAEARNNAKTTSPNGVRAAEPPQDVEPAVKPAEVQGVSDLDEIDMAFLAILQEDCLIKPSIEEKTEQSSDTVTKTADEQVSSEVEPQPDFELQLEPTVSQPEPPQPPAEPSASRESRQSTKKSRSKAMDDHTPDARVKMPRSDTDRGMVLGLMDGTKTPDEIAAILKKRNARFDVKYVYAHAYCLHRDCGIGYRTVDGKLEAVFPPAGGSSP